MPTNTAYNGQEAPRQFYTQTGTGQWLYVDRDAGTYARVESPPQGAPMYNTQWYTVKDVTAGIGVETETAPPSGVQAGGQETTPAANRPSEQLAGPVTGGGAGLPQGTSSPTGTTTPTGTPTTSTPTTGGTGSPSQLPNGGQQATQSQQLTDQQFNEWLAAQPLTPDQKAALAALYGAVGENDMAKAEQIKAALEAGTAYSDPYFKAQVRLITDALDRSFKSKEGDLAFNENQLSNALADLQKDIAASKDQLSFEHSQELQNLARAYEINLDSTRTDMAARGFTTSTVRSKAEQYLSDTNAGLVESSNRNFAYKNQQLTDQTDRAARDTALQIANLQRLVSEGKVDALRNAEAQVGTQNLSDLGYTGLLGGVGGEVPRAQSKDALDYASAIVF